MGTAARAIGINQRGLSAPPSATAALCVVSRSGRHVAHVDQVQLGNVHPEFHGGRTEEQGQVGGAEAFFPVFPVFGSDLCRVFAGFEQAFEVYKFSVAFHKIGIDFGRYVAYFEQTCAILRTHLAVACEPAQGGMVNLITGNIPAAHLLHDSVALKRQK